MKHRFALKCLIFAAGFFICTGLLRQDALADQKTEELKRKIADITLLNHQLKDRTQKAENARNSLKEQQKELMSEISFLVKSEDIKNLKQADQNLRIHYNIELLGTLEAYIQELESKILFYQTGRDKLTYLSQLASDDIKMITTLNDLQIDALTTQISLVINRYLPEAHVIQIDPVRIESVSPERVWASLANLKQ